MPNEQSPIVAESRLWVFWYRLWYRTRPASLAEMAMQERIKSLENQLRELEERETNTIRDYERKLRIERADLDAVKHELEFLGEVTERDRDRVRAERAEYQRAEITAQAATKRVQ